MAVWDWQEPIQLQEDKLSNVITLDLYCGVKGTANSEDVQIFIQGQE